MNGLVDRTIIEALYEASSAGVQIQLIIRGICCLRPGIPGVSENITVRSIVGRFLEHSRIYYFANGGSPLVYVGSADWMPRNLYNRIEVVFPVEEPGLKARIIDEILTRHLADNTKSWILQKDGSHCRPACEPAAERYNSQVDFLGLSLGHSPKRAAQTGAKDRAKQATASAKRAKKPSAQSGHKISKPQ
jgi:polyphosphate kinase